MFICTYYNIGAYFILDRVCHSIVNSKNTIYLPGVFAICMEVKVLNGLFYLYIIYISVMFIF